MENGTQNKQLAYIIGMNENQKRKGLKMKLYQINDTYRGKRRYEAELGKANWVASFWLSELEVKEISSPEGWIEIRVLKNKNEILEALNYGEKASV